MSTSISSSFSTVPVPDLLSVIKSSSFQRNGRNAADEAERTLIRREEELRNQVKDLTKEVIVLTNERDSLKILHGLAEAEKISMEDKLKKTEVHCEELSALVDKAIKENESLAYNMRKSHEMEHVKKAEALGMKKISELEEAKRAGDERTEMMEGELKKKIAELDEANKAVALGMRTIAELEEAKRDEDERMGMMEAELKKKIRELDEAKKAEALRMETIAELEKKNKKLEKAIMQDRDFLKQRISDIEVIVPDLCGNDVEVARQNNLHDDLNSCRGLRSSSDSGGDHSSHRKCLLSSSGSGGNHSSHKLKQDPAADNCDVDVCKKEPVDVCKKEPVVGSPIAAAEGPKTPRPNTPIDIIVISDSDDESTADESAVSAKTSGVNLNPSLNEMPYVVKNMPFVKTGEQYGMRDSSCKFVYGRKRKRSISSCDEAKISAISWENDSSLFSNGINLESTFKEMPSVNKKMASVSLVRCGKTALISGDEANTLGLCSQKTQDTVEIFDVDDNLLFDSKSMAIDTEVNVSPAKRTSEINDLQELDGNHSKDQPSLRNHILTDTVASDCNSSDSDDGFTADSDIDNTIKKLKIVKSAEDLASKCKKNYELCMKAVCALYRLTVANENLANDTSIASPGLFHFNRMGGKELAELLTKGDRKHRLMSSVADLQPEALKRCRELALCYNMKLFEIYRKGKDPFFCCLNL